MQKRIFIIVTSIVQIFRQFHRQFNSTSKRSFIRPTSSHILHCISTSTPQHHRHSILQDFLHCKAMSFSTQSESTYRVTYQRIRATLKINNLRLKYVANLVKNFPEKMHENFICTAWF